MVTPKIKLTAILIEDPNDKGYTAFFAEFPEIVAEGNTQNEAQLNLIQTMAAVFEYKKHENASDNFTSKFITKPMIFELETT